VFLVVRCDYLEDNIKHREGGVLEGERERERERQRQRETDRQTDRQRTYSERRLEDFLSVGMGQGPT
jgi:hypothetical protein